jgi:hypothetical protein
VKRSELRADPQRVAEWQRRSRRPLARSALPIPAGSGVERMGPVGAKAVPFKARTPARTKVCRCGARATGYHHWLPQQHIRAALRSITKARGLSDREHDVTLRKALRDERNLSPLCSACHMQHEHPGVDTPRFGADDVPGSALEFAAELGAEWRAKMDVLYPAARGADAGGTGRRKG